MSLPKPSIEDNCNRRVVCIYMIHKACRWMLMIIYWRCHVCKSCLHNMIDDKMLYKLCNKSDVNIFKQVYNSSNITKSTCYIIFVNCSTHLYQTNWLLLTCSLTDIMFDEMDIMAVLVILRRVQLVIFVKTNLHLKYAQTYDLCQIWCGTISSALVSHKAWWRVSQNGSKED